MSIDHVTLTRELTRLRQIAAEKVQTDGLPTGRHAYRQVWTDICDLGLEGHAVELEVKGFTVLPPGMAAPLDFCERLRDRILKLGSEESEPHLAANDARGQLLWHILHRDTIFEEALMAPHPLALAAFLVGYRAKLNQCTGSIKTSRSLSDLYIHADQSRKIPAPWPTDAQYCTITWALTDYSRENGAVCVFPGTHRLCVDVPDDFVAAHDHPDLEVIEAPAGSVIIWHGGLWHGAVKRQAPGQRVALMLPLVRFHLLPQELLWMSTTPEMLERNSSRFAALMGLLGSWPWGADGPDTSYARPSWLTTRWENRFA